MPRVFLHVGPDVHMSAVHFATCRDGTGPSTHMLVFRVTRVDMPMATLEARVSLRMQFYMDTWWEEVGPELSARRQ